MPQQDQQSHLQLLCARQLEIEQHMRHLLGAHLMSYLDQPELLSQRSCGTATSKLAPPSLGYAQLATAKRPSNPSIHIFIENSYMFIEAQKTSARELGLRTESDPRLRINPQKLMDYFCRDKSHIASKNCRVYASEDKAMANVWKNMSQTCDAKVQVFARSAFTGKEKLVCTSMVADMTELSLSPTDYTADDTVVILSSNPDILPGVQAILDETPMHVEFHVYSASVSGSVQQFAQRNLSRVRLMFLDQQFSRFTFLQINWDTSKKRIPAERTLVVSFRAVSGRHARGSLQGSDWSDSDVYYLSTGSEARSTSPDAASEYNDDNETDSCDDADHVATEVSLGGVRRAHLRRLVTRALTQLLRISVASTWHDESRLLVPIVLSETHGEFSMPELIPSIEQLERDLQLHLRFAGVHGLQVSLCSHTQFMYPVQHEHREAARLQALLTAPRHISALSAAPCVTDGGDDEFRLVRVKDRTPSRRYQPAHSIECTRGFKCGHGLRCLFTHTEAQREFFHANRGVGSRLYKTESCTQPSCRYRKTPHLCAYRHKGEPEPATTA